MARVCIVGVGYVGLTTGVCLASFGHDVTCLDIDPLKIEKLKRGIPTIYEDGLADLLTAGLTSGKLSFTTDYGLAVLGREFIFLCLPTPENVDGTVDISFVHDAVSELAAYLASDSVVVVKSTCPVGTADEIAERLSVCDVHVVSNPEFLREGSAIRDFMAPDRIVIGSRDNRASTRVEDLYVNLNSTVLHVDPISAELGKYASNSFLATKIAFINSIANLCDLTDGDVRAVAKIMGSDPRIGTDFLRPGPGFGGSCFPKDAIGLSRFASARGLKFHLLEQVIEANRHQLDYIFDKVDRALGSKLDEARVAVLGLTFKAGTDDLRHSPSLELCQMLIGRDCHVAAFDPTVKERISTVPNLEVCESAEVACAGADVILIMTEWDEFRHLEPERLSGIVSQKQIIDARNVLEPDCWTDAGFIYQGIGVRAS